MMVKRNYGAWNRRVKRAANEEDHVNAPSPSFIVTVEGNAVHVVCATHEQALEQAELLSQGRHRRVLVQEESAAAPTTTPHLLLSPK